jgi:hypothetical protein
MRILEMPANPTVGQVYIPTNDVIYTWTGDRWSSKTAIESGTAQYVADNQFADFVYDPDFDNIFNGGTA